MKNQQPTTRPVATATTSSTTNQVTGFTPSRVAQRLVVLPDGSIGTYRGWLDYDRQQTVGDYIRS